MVPLRPSGIIVLALLLAVPLAAQGQKPQQQSHGRLFPPEDLGILEPPDRADWQHPDEVMDALLSELERSQTHGLISEIAELS